MTDQIDPLKDGVNHINTYSKGLTALGKALSNFPRSPFHHPLWGSFDSAEGLWYYLSTGLQHEALRNLSGFKAKEFGKTLERVHNDRFDQDFRIGLIAKIVQNPELCKQLLESTLPFEHYYVYGTPPSCKVVVPESGQKIVNWLEDIRTFLKGDFL